jgi:aspartate aminotransferase
MLQGTLAKVHPPKGGFYLFPDFNALRQGSYTSETLCAKILADTGVALLPGNAFGMPDHHLSARLAYVDFDGAAAMAASEGIGLSNPLPDHFMQDYAPNMIRGMTALRDWLQVHA